MKKYLVLVLLLPLVFLSCSGDDDNSPAIKFITSGGVVEELSRNELLDIIPTFEISYYDTVYRKNKNLRAFSLRDVLVAGFGDHLETADGTLFRFHALDGYQVEANRALSFQAGGYVAFEDLDVDGLENWEPVATENNNDPAPYYVFWNGASQVPAQGYPWPYQLHTIVLTH